MLTPLLKHGALFIDNSTLESFSECPTKFNYTALHKRVLNSSRASLIFGSAVHKALETRYLIKGRAEVDAGTANIMLMAGKLVLENENMPVADYRSETYLANLIRQYNAAIGNEPFEVVNDQHGNPIVERGFAMELGSIGHGHPDLPNPLKIIWTGRIDLLVRFTDGSISVLDHKTSALGGEYYFQEYKNNQPQLGYVYAARQQVDPSINTFIINSLVCRKPKADGSVNFEFARQRFYVDPDKLDEWKTNILAQIHHIIHCDMVGYYPMTMKSCISKYGACPYLDLCTIPRAGRAQVLSSTMFRDNNWTPLH